MKTECKRIRENILRISHHSGHGHTPSCFSVVEILYAVYDHMRQDPKNPLWEKRDRFILSKGHAALAHYCVLSHFGYFPVSEVYSYGSFMSPFGCHADRLKVPGVELSTGSLGHGIGVAVGVALGLKLKAEDCQVYTLIGDGEANEGTVWEAIMVSVHLGLENLTVIYDNNNSQTRSLQITEPAGRFLAFGCKVFEVVGHNVEERQSALQERHHGVKVIVANTKKGFGCRTLFENMFEWHRKSPDDEDLTILLEELNEATV